MKLFQKGTTLLPLLLLFPSPSAMPLYYALPLAFGLTGAIAITLVLIEVVPRVLEERERRKSREGRAVAIRKKTEEPVQARGSARDENGWGYKIRQRKGKGKKDQRDEGQEVSLPSWSHQDLHLCVLGSDSESVFTATDQN